MLIDLGIAANKNQDSQWWGDLMPLLMKEQERLDFRWGKTIVIGSALADFNRNEIAASFGPSNTAENRNAIVEDHMWGDPADAIMWIDDDTVPPPKFMEKLLDIKADIVAGVYFNRNPPYEPIIYQRKPNKMYVPLRNYRVGEILWGADSVGMGCTLVYRHVYERIMEEYTVLARADTATRIPIHKDDIVNVERMQEEWREYMGKTLLTNDGIVRFQELVPLEREIERWPFYVMEYERTEDHHFCEMAKRVGCSIAVDTAVECLHWGSRAYGGEDFRALQRQYKKEKGQ